MAEDPPASEGTFPKLRAVVARVERDHIQKALERSQGNKEHASRDLGIAKQTLYEKIRLYGL